MDYRKEQEDIMRIIDEIRKALETVQGGPQGRSHKEPLTVDDLEAVLERTQEMIDQLNQKANMICEKLNMTRDELSAFVANPDNFNKEDWEAIQRMQEHVEQFHKTLVRAMFLQKNEALVSSQREDHKKRRLGLRRNWQAM